MCGISQSIKSDLTSKFGKITARISCDSDGYRGDGYNYACAVIYAINGDFSWENKKGDAAGRRGRSFYIIIKCTNDWPDVAFKSRGSGVVHSHLIEKALGFDMGNSYEARKVCASGFAWKDGTLRLNSYPLNGTDQNNGESDGSSALSPDEELLVRFFWDKYKVEGPNNTFDIPSYLLTYLTN